MPINRTAGPSVSLINDDGDRRIGRPSGSAPDPRASRPARRTFSAAATPSPRARMENTQPNKPRATSMNRIGRPTMVAAKTGPRLGSVSQISDSSTPNKIGPATAFPATAPIAAAQHDRQQQFGSSRVSLSQTRAPSASARHQRHWAFRSHSDACSSSASRPLGDRLRLGVSRGPPSGDEGRPHAGLILTQCAAPGHPAK